MARTTPELVAEILDVDASFSLTPLIEMANEIVTEVCASATKDDGSAYYTDARLELIERLVAAHFYRCLRDPLATSETAGSVAATYQSRTDLGFDLTHYGQQAKRLDTYGGLAALDAAAEEGAPRPQKPAIAWLGTAEE